jgi:hypothetical protein
MEINRDSLSSGERKGISLNRREEIPFGVVGPQRGTPRDSGTVWKGRPETVIARYAKSRRALEDSRVPRGT